MSKQSTKVERVCLGCGIKFMAFPSEIKRGKANFHSYQCFRRPLEERFWDRVEKTETCWLWTAGCFPSGYGEISIHNHPVYAHRVSWELAYGTIPDGMMVLHNCPGVHNKKCVNPDHLYLGTHEDNMTDASRLGQSPRGERHPLAKLTTASVMAIRERYAVGGITKTELAEQFGVTRSVIGKVIRRELWKHV